ncbi:MAG: FAD-dependent oxidoreductase, partial [Methylobacteriaceae bacterium]|nr:FAD-dependent oxidoreductase [Methylobacteriaceae bacterium]
MARVSPPGFVARRTTLRFSFEGRSIEAAPGETIAAALVAAGEVALRGTRTGDLRGPFCGMGVCHDCLVAVDGRTARACMTAVADGMGVTRHRPDLPAPATPGPPPPATRLAADVVVVGAGPAGLSAALAAAECGADALVVDERKQPGGQYHKQPAEALPIVEAELDRQFREGRALRRRAEAAGVRFLREATAWAAQDGDLLVGTPSGACRIAARRIVLATGAAETCPPFPGWTLPGVMTTGAAQTFLRAYGVVPGRRLVIAGVGPLNLQLAAELAAAGAQVVAVVEGSAAPGLAAAPLLARMALAAPRLVIDGLDYRRRLRRAGAPLLHRAVILRAEGEGRLERAVVAPLDADGAADHAAARVFACDALCLGYGFAPSIELAASMGCDLRYDRRWRHLTVATDAEGRSSLPHVFAAGDGARFGGARVALAAGRLAGLAAARDLGFSDRAGGPDAASAPRRDLARARAFQDALWRLYDASA